MSENGGYMSGMGQPGERQTGKLDAKTQAWLVILQGVLHFALGVVALLAAILCAFALGGWLTTLALTVFVWARSKIAVDWADEHVENATLFSIIVNTEMVWPVAVFIIGALITRWVLPYRWVFDLEMQRHFIYTKQYDLEYGMVWEAGRNFSLLLRAFLIALPIAWFGTAPIIRRRFADELAMAVPAKAESYADRGFNTRRWGPKPEPPPAAPVDTRRIEKVVAQGAVGKGNVKGYDDLRHWPDIERAFQALDQGIIPWLSRRNLRDLGIGSDTARDIMEQLETWDYIEYPKKGQAAVLTEWGEGLLADARKAPHPTES